MGNKAGKSDDGARKQSTRRAVESPEPLSGGKAGAARKPERAPKKSSVERRKTGSSLDRARPGPRAASLDRLKPTGLRGSKERDLAAKKRSSKENVGRRSKERRRPASAERAADIDDEVGGDVKGDEDEDEDEDDGKGEEVEEEEEAKEAAPKNPGAGRVSAERRSKERRSKERRSADRKGEGASAHVSNKSSGSGDSGDGAVHPMVAALQAAKRGAAAGPAASGSSPPGRPGGALPPPPALPALRPVFRPGDFEKAKLNRVGGAASDNVATGERTSMDTVRQNAINDAKKCSKEATEVYPFLRVSGDWVARNKELLLESGVTHVLNMAHTVCRNYHEDTGEFEYLALDVIDSASESITPFLLEAIVFIEKARKANGCCYVHCHMGVSRSCTVCIAYVMLREKMGFQEAFDHVKKLRPVCSPNAGFLGQLQAWDKTLNTKPERPELYRVARHSAQDPTLVVKMCYAKDSTDPVRARPTELDARGLFMLHDHASKRFYLWRGPRCGDPEAFEAAARQFGQWMIDLLPSFKRHTLVDSKRDADAQEAFWVALGVDKRDAPEMTDADVDQDLVKYDPEYSKQAKKPSPQRPKPAHIDTGHAAAKGTSSPRSELSPRSPASGRGEGLKVQLFSWLDEQENDLDHAPEEPGPRREWERIRNYDVDDLQSKSMYLVLAHDRAKAKAAKQGRRTIHLAYLWVGSLLEGRLNREAGIAKAKAFVAFCCTQTRSPPVELVVEEDSQESSAFWEAFESGY